MKKLEPYENQMTYLVGGSRLPSTPGERELEHKCNPHPNDWIDGIYSFNKLPFAVRMQKGLVTQAEDERRKGRYGYLSDFFSYNPTFLQITRIALYMYAPVDDVHLKFITFVEHF